MCNTPILFNFFLIFFYDGEINTLCQVSLTLAAFKAIISNLIYGEFERGNCGLSEIYAAMLHVSFEFWLVGLSRGWRW